MHGQTQPSTTRVVPAGGATRPHGPQQQVSTQQLSNGVATIHAYSNLVVVDVVVSDAKKNPVHGLKASDFTLLENGKPQVLRNFEVHNALPARDIKYSATPKMPPGLFTNKTAAPVNGPANILLLDYLNTPTSSQLYARKQLLDYLDKAPPGTRIAIFGLTTHLDMLQGFTSDMSVLKNALTLTSGTPQSSQLMADSFNGGPEASTVLSDNYDNFAVSALTPVILNDIERFQAMQASFVLDMRARYTLNAFDDLARYLVGIPGRKNVIWFSGSFPLDVEPDVNDEDPNDSVVRNDDEVRMTDNLLTRAQVAVYPVDARGLQTDPSQNFAAQSLSTNIDANSGSAGATETAAFLTQTSQEQETMMEMADDTGGEAFVNTNGLTQAVSKAIENGSNYYTLTYTPTNPAWDARFRAIKIKVDAPDVKLNYRNGYYAVDPNSRNKMDAQGAATALSRPTTMSTAMMHGGPAPSEILFKMRIRPSSTPPQETILKSNQANPNVKVDGPYKAYGVDLVPDAHAVSCNVVADGNRHCAIEVWTFVYDSNGDKLITASNRHYSFLTAADYDKMVGSPATPGTGMAFHQEISVPVKGQYYLRTAIHDMISDKVGAVEVPIGAVARLDPLQPLPAVAAPAETTPDATDIPAVPTTAAPTSVIVPGGLTATPQ
jgi:VWFA-related protein